MPEFRRAIALAAAFVQQSRLSDENFLIDSLDHVVNGERGNRCGGERLHFDTRTANRRDLCHDPKLGFVLFKFNVDLFERNGMTVGDQFEGLLSRQ